jgi:hypothetical protein
VRAWGLELELKPVQALELLERDLSPKLEPLLVQVLV